MTPLLAAAVTGHIHIVEHLISKENLVSRKERIDALELLGATFVDKKRDMLGALKLWKRAMEERYKDGVLVIPKALVKSPISAYENTLEVESVAALEEIISDPDSMRMQALLVRERILGPAHPDTSYYIRYRGAVYADMGHFERCITLWMYALDMQQKMLEPLSPMTQSSLLSFAELFSYMMSEGRNRNNNQRRSPPIGGLNLHNNAAQAAGGEHPIPGPALGGGAPPTRGPRSKSGHEEQPGPQGAPNHSSSSSPNHPPVNFCDIMSVFEKAVTEVKQGQEAFSNQTSTQTGNASPQERDITYFNRTLVIILHLICLLTKLLPHLDAKQTHQVKKAVFDFIKVGARGRGGATALHLACSRDSSAVGRYPICQFPSAEVISLLLECGADVEALDNEDNYPLHTAASNKPAKPNVVSTLLDSGAHLDAVNGEGRTFGELLRGQAVHEVVTVLKYSNLQCLAARAVRKQSIPHRGQIPAKLSDFVDLH